jgi:SpoVK/Ycf46/Vps4 family AAA+-type ATPase
MRSRDIAVPTAAESPASPPLPMPEPMVQYSIRGEGYVPTPQTIQVLPPGMYKIGKKNGPQESWVSIDPLNTMTDELINFKNAVMDEILTETERFWNTKDKYKEYGFSHKRGYLLWGPPGSGKTCLVHLLARQMIVSGGVVFFVDNPHAFTQVLPQFRQVEPDRKLVVILEDIDATMRNEHVEQELLSVLDGELSVENVLFLATTNYPETLDKRLMNRPGRFDRVIKVDVPDAVIRAQFFQHKLKTTTKDGIDLVKITEGFSLGHLREFILGVYVQGDPIDEVVKRLKNMKTRATSGMDGTVGFGHGDDHENQGGG